MNRKSKKAAEPEVKRNEIIEALVALEQEKGISLLMVNTEHGSHVFDKLHLARQTFPAERAIAGNPRLASPIGRSADRTAFFAAYAVEDFETVRKKFMSLPPLPVRVAGKVLSPEIKAKIRSKLK